MTSDDRPDFGLFFGETDLIRRFKVEFRYQCYAEFGRSDMAVRQHNTGRYIVKIAILHLVFFLSGPSSVRTARTRCPSVTHNGLN